MRYIMGALMATSIFPLTVSAGLLSSPLHGTNKVIHYENKNGFAIYQGDIILGKISDINTNGLCWNHSRIEVCRSDVNSAPDKGVPKWSNGVVPYHISDEYDDSQKDFIKSDMKKLMNVSEYRIKLREYDPSKDKNYIEIVKGGGCSSYVGMIGGKQTVSLANGCLYGRIVQHELMHALGFQHEQTRPDRDKYVKINYENIQDGVAYNFDVSPNVDLTIAGPYDFTSIMHYSLKAFSKNGKETITPLEPTGIDDKIGSYPNLSEVDLLALEKTYNNVSTQCPAPSVFKNDNCLVVPEMPASSWVFKKDGFLYLGIKNKSECPENTIDEGVFEDGRHCYTQIELKGNVHELIKGNALYVTPYFRKLTCPEHTESTEESCLVVKNIQGPSRVVIRNKVVTFDILKTFECPEKSVSQPGSGNYRTCVTRVNYVDGVTEPFIEKSQLFVMPYSNY